MKCFLGLISFISVACNVFRSLDAADCFYDNIEQLAPHDAKLYSRSDVKNGLISKGMQKSEWLKVMQKIDSFGNTFACGYTRSWIEEILQGLDSQYDELVLKNNSGWPAAGFVNVTGQKVVDLFNSNVNSTKRILYKFQIVGPLDHVWMVEQLAHGRGYRVYQSYNNAYSLKAWLAKGNLTSLLGTDIIIWHDVIRMADAAIKPKGGSMSNLDNLPAALLSLKPWLVYIRDYNLTQVKAELMKGWGKIGQGRIMPKDYFYKNYLTVLANLTESIVPFVGSSKLWTRELHEQWTSLFGAPNPVLFPGYPFKTMTAQFSQNYALEVKVFKVNASDETKCAGRVKILKESLADCFYKNVHLLSNYDALLYSRHDKKNGLIAAGTMKSEYLTIMTKIKSSGKTFACGYTRGWIAEILQGLDSQYDELQTKRRSGWPAAGFVNVTGQKVVDLFNSNLKSMKRILYKFQIVGPLDHVWMVEQLAYGRGYRVYQSYNNAYSLKAWLAKGNLTSLLGTDIIIWHDVIRMADAAIKPRGGSMSNLDNLPAALLSLKPWLVYIRDYNLTQVKAELMKGWGKIGQGRIMPKDYFYKNYLTVLANLTESIVPFVGSSKLWTRELHEQWTSLFGAPNPVLFPGYPFKTLTAAYSQKYALEVKALKIEYPAEAKCAARAKILEDSLPDCFFDKVKLLANYDALLYSRHDEKNSLIAKGVKKPEYLAVMSKIKSSGKKYACGYTRGWIAEILQGLDSQYDELQTKRRSGWPAAGFVNVTGQKVVDLFNSNLKSMKRILYKFQIVGPLDHVWMVEQLAYGRGYRVYQSYNNAYSLKAWLAKGNLTSLLGTDIIIWHDVIRMADAAIKPRGGSMSNLDNLPAALLSLKPWLVYIRDYNLTQVKAELMKGWGKIGQGRIMPKDYFYKNYLTVLANLTESIVPFVGSSKLWTRELHEQWTSLFGAPNPVLFPGYPFKTMTAAFSQNYSLQVKVLKIEYPAEAKCAARAKILEDSLKDCFFDTVKNLSSNDILLNSRLDEKKNLITKGTKKDNWLAKMNTIKSSGKSFACGFTRSWITEILQGLSSQYDELLARNNSGTAAAGFTNVTGWAVVDAFNSNLNSKQRILYKFQIVGPLDHVWLVEQLPYNGGYRVYQSYNNAYSLKAWLMTSNLKSLHGHDIIVWHDVVRMATAYLKKHGGSMSDLNNLPLAVCTMKPWLEFIRDYNFTQIDANLQLAQKKFGMGQIISKEFFYKNYLHVLANLTRDTKPLVNTPKKWTKELHDQWISLFGSPNPVLFPGYHFNQLTRQYSQNYALELKTLVISDADEKQCIARGHTLEKSLHCFFDGVKELSAFDTLLNSRLENKTSLIRKSTNKTEFVKVMNTIKSSGKTFACGFTRSWIAEILQGLESQYEELSLKIRSGNVAAGFVNVTGQKVVNLFNSNLKSMKRILYKFQIVGPLDHVWMVEQLAYGRGYRVYQSYNNAYSLEAWLAKGNLTSLLGTDIIIWHDVVRMADAAIKPRGGSMSNLDNLPAALLSLKPWLVYIRDYNLTQVKAELMKGWGKIGQGRIMPKDYFYKNYLTVLANLTESIVPFVGSSKLWTRELHEQWTSLFGAPNPVLFPGYPFKTMTAQFSQNYSLQVKVLKINVSEEANCAARVGVLRKSVFTPTTAPPSTKPQTTAPPTTSLSSTSKPTVKASASANKPGKFMLLVAIFLIVCYASRK